MEATQKFTTLHNLRVVRKNAESRDLVFRSARQEKLSSEETQEFMKLDIKTIVDLRGPAEYNKGTGERRLDSIYKQHIAKIPKFSGNFDDAVVFKSFSSSSQSAFNSVDLKRVFVPVTSRFYFRFFCATRTLPLGSLLLRLALDCVSLFRFEFIKAAVVRQLKINGLSWFYKFTLEFSGASISSALKILAEPKNLPALINCFYGKDRTGLVAALVLHVMGEPFEVIRDDFVASEAGLDRSRETDMKELNDDFGFSGGVDFHHATAENIDTAFAFLRDTYGSVDAYLDSIGFDQSWRGKLRKCLH